MSSPRLFFHRFQFSITWMLGATTVIGLILTGKSKWTLVATVEIIAVSFAIESLVRNLPARLEAMMLENCFRSDGSYSANRESVEKAAIRKLRVSLVTLLVILLMPLNVMILLHEFGWAWLDQRVLWLTGIWFLLTFSVLGVVYPSMLRGMAKDVADRKAGYQQRSVGKIKGTNFEGQLRGTIHQDST